MLLIALSVPHAAFNKAVFNGLIIHLDLCYILIIFAATVEFHSGFPTCDLGLTPRKEAERREKTCSTLDLTTFPN